EEISQFEPKPILVFTGGDPLMRDDVYDLIEYGGELGIKTAVTPAPTPLMTRENIEKLKKSGAERIALSLDGSTKARHDELRGVSRSFEAILDAATYAREADLPIQINTTITKETVNDLKGIAELTEQLGAVLWSLFFLVPVGRGEKLEMVSPEEAERIMDFLYREEQKRPYQVKTTEATHYRRVVLQKSGRSLSKDHQKHDKIGRNIGVSDGNGITFVSRTGEIFPSGFLPLKAGSVLEEGLIKTYQESKLFKELRDKSLLKGKCGVCEYNSICGGSRARAYSIYGDYLAPDPLCAYYPEGWDGDLWGVGNSS
ncbi:radical SAM protein, partial [candidate division MSBL1 archaeon SCGC-AAA259B11]